MSRSFQFRVRVLPDIQGLIGSGLAMVPLAAWLWLRMPQWWVFLAVMFGVFGCFFAAIGLLVKQHPLLGIIGVAAGLIFCVVISVLAPFL